jgi:cell division protein FtsQ
MGAGLFLIVFVLWICAWLVLSGSFGTFGNWLQENTLEKSNQYGFSVANILVEGRYFTDPEAIKAILNTAEGSPIFAFNPKEAKKLIEKLSWVDTAHVERRLPDTIYVRIEEKKPLAIWQNDGEIHIIDEKGDILSTKKNKMEAFQNLTIVVGEGANLKASDIIELLKSEPELKKRTEAAILVSDRRWNLRLKNGTTIKLPEFEEILAMRRLVIKHEDEGILDKNVKVIDIREPDRITVRTKPGAIIEYKTEI